ncbi:MAG: alcohol dehydrogenase catalytic domain-containing protein [Phycisphaerae bacterium]
MQAIHFDASASPSLRSLADYPDPQPRDDEALIRVHLAGICATDLEICRGYMQFRGVPGHEFVGVVEQGPASLVGRRVVAEINCVCDECDMCRNGMPKHCRRRTVVGIQGRDGAFAELLCVPTSNCYLVPDDLSDEHAVFTEPLAAALQVIALQPISLGARVALIGTGRLGLLVAQVLKQQGCDLLAIGRNPTALQLCAALGVHAVHISQAAPAADRDMVVECTGSPEGLRLALQMVRPRGTIVLKSTYKEPANVDLAPLVVNEIRMVGNRCGPFPAAIEMLHEKKIHVDELISATFPFSRGVEAFAAAADHANIKVLLRPDRL